eukprot:RCo008325
MSLVGSSGSTNTRRSSGPWWGHVGAARWAARTSRGVSGASGLPGVNAQLRSAVHRNHSSWTISAPTVPGSFSSTTTASPEALESPAWTALRKHTTSSVTACEPKPPLRGTCSPVCRSTVFSTITRARAAGYSRRNCLTTATLVATWGCPTLTSAESPLGMCRNRTKGTRAIGMTQRWETSKGNACSAAESWERYSTGDWLEKSTLFTARSTSLPGRQSPHSELPKVSTVALGHSCRTTPRTRATTCCCCVSSQEVGSAHRPKISTSSPNCLSKAGLYSDTAPGVPAEPSKRTRRGDDPLGPPEGTAVLSAAAAEVVDEDNDDEEEDSEASVSCGCASALGVDFTDGEAAEAADSTGTASIPFTLDSAELEQGPELESGFTWAPASLDPAASHWPDSAGHASSEELSPSSGSRGCSHTGSSPNSRGGGTGQPPGPIAGAGDGGVWLGVGTKGGCSESAEGGWASPHCGGATGAEGRSSSQKRGPLPPRGAHHPGAGAGEDNL